MSPTTKERPSLLSGRHAQDKVDPIGSCHQQKNAQGCIGPLRVCLLGYSRASATHVNNNIGHAQTIFAAGIQDTVPGTWQPCLGRQCAGSPQVHPTSLSPPISYPSICIHAAVGGSWTLVFHYDQPGEVFVATLPLVRIVMGRTASK